MAAANNRRTRFSRVAFAVRLAVLATALPAFARSLPAQGACRAADSISAQLIGQIRRYSAAQSGDNGAVRVSLQLPQTSNVVLVTSSTVCNKAKTAFATEFGSQGSGLSSQVYVVSVGAGGATVYAVVDPAYRYNNVPREGPWPFVYFVVSKYKKLSILAGR